MPEITKYDNVKKLYKSQLELDDIISGLQYDNVKKLYKSQHGRKLKQFSWNMIMSKNFTSPSTDKQETAWAVNMIMSKNFTSPSMEKSRQIGISNMIMSKNFTSPSPVANACYFIVI